MIRKVIGLAFNTEMGACHGKHRPSSSSSQDSSQKRTKAPKSSFGLLKRPHQPDVFRKSLVSEDLVLEIERLKEICEFGAKELQANRVKLKESNIGFEAMTVLVKYLTEELNAFSCPLLAFHLEETKGKLTDASKQIEDLVETRGSLLQEVKRLQEMHENELFGLRVNHQMEQQVLESRLKEESARKQEEVLHRLNLEISSAKIQHESEVEQLNIQHIEELQKRNEGHSETLQRLGTEFSEKIIDLNKSHETQVEELTKQFEETKMCLLEKVMQLKAECDSLQRQEKSCNATYHQESEVKIQNALLPYRYLEQEVESLRVVLDLRNQELAEVRQSNREMEKRLEEIPVARETINKLQQKIENLEAIINIKVDYERELAEKHSVLLRKYDCETKAKKRLSMDNEELVWRLSQSEAGSTPDIFRMSLNQLPTIPSGSQRDSHEPRQRPKSMVLLSHPITPSGGVDRPSQYRSSHSTGGVKLRRPRMFGSVDHSLVADMKLSEIKQSDV